MNTANFVAAAAIGVIVYIFWQHENQHSPQPVAWGSTVHAMNPRRVRGTVANFVSTKAPQRPDQVYAAAFGPLNTQTDGSTWGQFDNGYAPAFGANPGAYPA